MKLGSDEVFRIKSSFFKHNYKRHAKSTLPMYSEFGILPEAFLQAKQYYSSIDYNGYFIF